MRALWLGCIVVMQLDPRPSSSPCRWLNMQMNWSSVICGSDCSFVGHYVDNNRPLSIKENQWWTFSFLKGNLFSGPLSVWFIFNQPHHVWALVTHKNVRKSLRGLYKFLQTFATDRHPLFLLFCCQLVGDPSCKLPVPTKLLMGDSMCISVGWTKLQGLDCYSWVFYYILMLRHSPQNCRS